MPEYAVVGKRAPRVDALEKVTGAAMYSADIALPNMLHGKVLRSPYPHAVISRLDTRRARSLKGVMAVITAADVPGNHDEREMISSERPHLAAKKATYAGQPVAAVAAINPAVAEEALGLVEVTYEELPPLLDVREAMAADAPLVCPDMYAEGSPWKGKTPSNIAWRVAFERGDLETGFKEADLVLENTFRTQTVHQGYLEPMAAVAGVDLSGKVTVWTPSQGIFAVRGLISEFLKIPLSRVKVVPVEVGGAFGGKTYQLLAPLCALLACKTGRPVKMVMTREEVLKASRPAPSSRITLKTGVTNGGRITAASVDMVFDSGAFPERPFAINAALHGLGLYRIPNLKIEGVDVLTNKVPSGSYRAPGAPQAAFAVESQMDLISRALDMDPLALRIENAVVEGDLTPHGLPFPRIGFKETLERTTEALKGRKAPEGENRGRGIACGFWLGGLGCSAAYVNVNADASVNLVVGSVDLSGTRTTLAQIVAEELGIPLENVTVTTGDTETAPYSTESVGSRTTYHMGTAVYRACQDAKAQIARQAAPSLGVAPDALEFVGGRVQVKGTPDKSLSLAFLVRNSISASGEGPATGKGSVGVPPQHAPAFSVHVADVAVDRETGKVKILSYTAGQDVGRAINPTLVEGQIQGAVSQGIGWALTENYVLDNGVMQNTTLLDYQMPTAADLPFMETLLVEVGSTTGPYGIRPVGEPPIIPSLAAVANAVHSAVGLRLKELPLRPEALFRALRTRDV